MNAITRMYGRREPHVGHGREFELEGLEGATDFRLGLRTLMDKKRVSRAALARTLGVSAAYVTKVLGEGTNLTLRTMERLARAAGGSLRVEVLDATVGVPDPVRFATLPGGGMLAAEPTPHYGPRGESRPSRGRTRSKRIRVVSRSKGER